MAEGMVVGLKGLRGSFHYYGKLTAPPVVLGGCGRSGTTLALSILSSHPDIFAIPQETKVLCPGAYEADFDVLHKPRLRLAPLFPHLADLRARPRATRWCEKTPKNVLFFPEILSRFSRRVKLLHLVRDGRDVILSKHPLRPDAYWVSPERWIEEVQAGLRLAGDPNLLLVRYEDLVLDFRDTVRRIERFLELEHRISDSWLSSATVTSADSLFGKMGPVRKDSIGRWKRSPEARERIEAFLERPMVSELLKRLGYT